MHSEQKILAELLRRQYQITVGLVAFVDESYRAKERPDEYPFYTVTALVIDSTDLSRVRTSYASLVKTGRWHTTTVFKDRQLQEIKSFINLVITLASQSIISVQVDISDNNLEHARRECMVQLISTLEVRGCKLVVIEQREDRKSRNADDALIQKAKAAGLLGRHVKVMQSQPSVEPLLWGPDLIGWAMRRMLALGDEQWISPLLRQLTIIDASATQRLNAKGPQPAAAMGSGPESSVEAKPQVMIRSSGESIAYAGDKTQESGLGAYRFFQPVHSPTMLSQWLVSEFPKH